ncbi:MAG TPA: PEP-utilizing enzyme, partial [Candidatus Eremiobacteraceae bacterium]|nr:PEP-utilizing enzyme [Candidatus Eremiobacteraceae bacterium]
LVSGDCDADTYHVERDGRITQRAIANKHVAHRAMPGSGEGVAAQPVDASIALQPALDDRQIGQVAELVRQAERAFGAPQDIEWAIQSGELYLLQSRPITTLAASSDSAGAGARKIWDNSNIAESYGGVTTPLTFSFARHAYDGAYRQFCRLMHISEATIAAHDDTFRNMLGLIQGRVYYNLLNWYRVLAMLPGYRLNRRFMEQMMGVKESLPDGVLEPVREASISERMRDAWNVVTVALAFAGHYFSLRRRCDAFFAWLRETLGAERPDYTSARPEELVAAYRRLESRLITRWDAPLINDLFAMIFFGTLRRLCERWCGDTEGTLQNGLVSGQGGMISAEPAKLVIEMARVAAQQPAAVSALSNGSLQEALAATESSTRLSLLYREYLDKFGDRTTDELKLESPTLHDDPLMLLRSVGHLAERFTTAKAPVDEKGAGETLRRAAERRVADALRGNPFRQVVFSWALRNARERIIARENLRFERTRLFGRVRSIFTALGHAFARAGILPDADLVFYLEVDEALGYVEGTTTSHDLAALTALRKNEFDRYRQMPPPPDRFETRGIVGKAAVARRPTTPLANETSDKDKRTGLGCCPGIVRGQVRVVTDPRQATLRAGEILVAERTDPGWVMLFPAASGLLVERGSLLSHSAIVAREMRIPAVVSVSGIMSWLKDGDWVELDGSAGTVVKIEPPVAASRA